MIDLTSILTGLNILEKLGNFWTWLRGGKSAAPETIATRFIKLFEAHGVHRNQIPRFIGHGISIKDVQDNADLIVKLDEDLLHATCEKFAVRRAWLDGADAQIYPLHDFYKSPKDFCSFINELNRKNPIADLHGVLIAPDETKQYANALLILQETVGFIDEKPIYRYHLCHDWYFAYWKARAYLTACIAIAWKQKIYVHGLSMSKNEIEKISSGKDLFTWGSEGIWELGHVRWYPEDMALKPEAFLQGVSAEENDFGIKSALTLWLTLHRQGWMDAGIDDEAWKLFQEKLAMY